MKRPVLLFIVCAVFTIYGLNFAECALIDGQTLYWNFDNNTDDAVGSNDGTLQGATYTATGKINGAYNYDGDNDRIDFTDYALSGEFTINLWANTHTLPPSTYSIYFGNKGSAATIVGTAYTTQQMNMYLPPASNLLWVMGTNTQGDETFHMFTYTRDSSNDIHTYFDGTEIGTKKAYSSTFTIDEVGRYSTSDVYCFDGVIDEVGIWNTEKTSTEVSELYNSGDGTQYPYSSPDTQVPVISDINCTSPTPDDITEPYTTSDTTPTFSLATNETATCSISDDNTTWTEFTTTGINTTHIGTLPIGDALSYGDDLVYMKCCDAADNCAYEELDMYIIRTACECPGINVSWEIDLNSSCEIRDNCNIGTGNITYLGSFMIDGATITASSITYPSALILNDSGNLIIEVS